MWRPLVPNRGPDCDRLASMLRTARLLASRVSNALSHTAAADAIACVHGFFLSEAIFIAGVVKALAAPVPYFAFPCDAPPHFNKFIIGKGVF